MDSNESKYAFVMLAEQSYPCFGVLPYSTCSQLGIRVELRLFLSGFRRCVPCGRVGLGLHRGCRAALGLHRLICLLVSCCPHGLARGFNWRLLLNHFCCHSSRHYGRSNSILFFCRSCGRFFTGLSCVGLYLSISFCGDGFFHLLRFLLKLSKAFLQLALLGFQLGHLSLQLVILLLESCDELLVSRAPTHRFLHVRQSVTWLLGFLVELDKRLGEQFQNSSLLKILAELVLLGILRHLGTHCWMIFNK